MCTTCFTAVFPESIALFITFFILFNNVVPISLYVTVEMVNFAQAHYIDNDIEMYVTSLMLHVVLLYCCDHIQYRSNHEHFCSCTLNRCGDRSQLHRMDVFFGRCLFAG